MRICLPIVTSALLALATIPSNAAPKSAHADLVNAQGGSIGHAKFSAVPDGVKVSITVSQLAPGEHGIHIHNVGKCDGPAFTTAGGHFNPTSAHHGINNTMAPKPHLGDLPNPAQHSATAPTRSSTTAAPPSSSTPRPTTL